MEKRAGRRTVLVVDDTPANLAILTGVLKDLYHVKIATNGEKALALAAGADKPDLVLLDVVMPGLDGYEVCRRLRADPATASIPVIFLTAKTEVEDETRGLELGAVDYIHKPFSPSIIVARVRTHLMLVEARDFLNHQNEILEEKVASRTREMSALQDVMILTLTSLAETRDNETGNHIRRTSGYIRELARKVAPLPRYQGQLTPETIELLYKSAPLHDIGKVGIPDMILLKPGRLTEEEFEIMKTHAMLGRDIIASAERELGFDLPFLHLAKEIAYSHHEKWDGSGYPEGRRGEEIPLAARLMAVADVYDALISKRVYKDAMPQEKALAIIRDSGGTHLDPNIVEVFLSHADEFNTIARRYVDGGAH